MTAEERAHRIVQNFFDVRFFEDAIEEAINKAIQQEREACLDIAQTIAFYDGSEPNSYSRQIAQAIRARGSEGK